MAANTRAKRTELDEQAVQTFYLSNAWQQNDLTDVQTAIRNVLPNAKVYAVPSQNAIVMRGTPDELLLAQKLINDLDKARPEVVVDIAVLEVSKNWEKTLGIAWPSSVGVALQPPTSSTSTTSSTTGTTGTTGTTSTGTAPTLYDLAHLKAYGFCRDGRLGHGQPAAHRLEYQDSAESPHPGHRRAEGDHEDRLQDPHRHRLLSDAARALAPGRISSLVNTQFQYQDVGVNIEMTPTVHFDRDVTLKIKIEVTSQSGSVTISGVTEPIISQRSRGPGDPPARGRGQHPGRHSGQTGHRSWTGIPGLSSIPILKYLFGSKDHTINDDELVFLVVPHVVRSQSLEQVNLRTVDTGAGTVDRASPRSQRSARPRIQLRIRRPAPAPAVRPPAHAQPNVGTVPGQSAMAAAPAALAQLSQAARDEWKRTPGQRRLRRSPPPTGKA